MHDIGNTFDPMFVSPDLYGVSGLIFAIIEDDFMPQAYISSRGLSVNVGKYQFKFRLNRKSVGSFTKMKTKHSLRFLCKDCVRNLVNNHEVRDLV